MLILHGATALSDFRLRKLNQQITDQISKSVSITTRFIHFVEADRQLTDDELKAIQDAL